MRLKEWNNHRKEKDPDNQDKSSGREWLRRWNCRVQWFHICNCDGIPSAWIQNPKLPIKILLRLKVQFNVSPSMTLSLWETGPSSVLPQPFVWFSYNTEFILLHIRLSCVLPSLYHKLLERGPSTDPCSHSPSPKNIQHSILHVIVWMNKWRKWNASKKHFAGFALL